MDPAAFQTLYCAEKPKLEDKNLIFFCQMGRRGLQATQLAQGLGYTGARNYAGAYKEWLTSGCAAAAILSFASLRPRLPPSHPFRLGVSRLRAGHRKRRRRLRRRRAREGLLYGGAISHGLGRLLP